VARFVIAFVLVATLFGLLERLYRRTWPVEEADSANARRRFGLRRDTRTDLLYTLFTPLVTRSITTVGLVIAALLLARAQGLELDLSHGAKRALAPFFEGTSIHAQPRWIQGVELALLLDLSSYWIHRLFHRRRLWPFHAVHHSSSRLTWLSSVRLHPVNDLLTRVLQVVLLLLLGFDPTLLAALVPFTGLYALLLHARVPWDFGPFRYVLASPLFHRWHHTSAAEGRDKNFAGLFPIWDMVFGTLYLPRAAPTRFGVDEPVPVSFLAQLTWPFRKRASHPNPASPPQGEAHDAGDAPPRVDAIDPEAPGEPDR